MRWMVFDYGEVISRRTRALPQVAELLNVPLGSLEPVYWSLRDPYDRGWSDLEYWREVGSRIGVDVDAEQADALTEADLNGWLSVDPETLLLLDELGEAGYGLCLLSNAPASHGQVFRRQPWAGRFRHMVISADLGIAKPDAAIWDAVIQRLGSEPADCVFLDDKQINVDSARVAGLHAYRWNGANAARGHLEDLGVL
jgi:putative hydrolase of the HAD superfamily